MRRPKVAGTQGQAFSDRGGGVPGEGSRLWVGIEVSRNPRRGRPGVGSLRRARGELRTGSGTRGRAVTRERNTGHRSTGNRGTRAPRTRLGTIRPRTAARSTGTGLTGTG